MITFEDYRQNPSVKNRNQLVEQNMGLVKKYAVPFSEKSYAELDDLIQEGAIGLQNAVERFDITKGNKFSSYAVPFIKGAMLHYIRDKTRMVRPPRMFSELVGKSSKFNHDSPTAMAKALGVTVDHWRQAKQAHIPPKSLESRLAADTNTTIADTIIVSHDPYQSLVVDDFLSHLDERERAIIEMSFYGEKTQKEIGEAIGVTHVTISRKRKLALKKLQALAA